MEDDELETTAHVTLEDVNPNLLCGLCDGYLIDATTIIECLHSFCRTCIVTYLKTSKSCPKCETLVHKTRPHLNIRSDKLLQDLVYKIVPGLYKDEMKRRREFYTINYEDAPKRPSEDRGDEMSDRFVFTQEELISLTLHYCPNNTNERSFHRIFKTKEEFKTRLERRSKDSTHMHYFQCKAAVCIKHIKKLVRLKYDLPPNYKIDMFYNDDPLRDSYSLGDVALSYNWRRKSPLKLYFSMYEMTMQKVAFGEEVPRLTHSTGIRWRQPPSSPSLPLTPPISEHDKINCVAIATTTTTSLSTPIVSLPSPSLLSTSATLPSVSASLPASLSSSSSSSSSSLFAKEMAQSSSIKVEPVLKPAMDTPMSSMSSVPPPLLSPPAKKLKLTPLASTVSQRESTINPEVKSKAKQQESVQVSLQQFMSPSKDNKPSTSIAPVGKPVVVAFANLNKQSSRGGNKKSLLGKRHASRSTPVLIAPAPAKKLAISPNVPKNSSTQQQQQPILRMAKVFKLGNSASAGVGGGHTLSQQTPSSSNSTPNPQNNSPSVSFIPISLSTVLPGASTTQTARAGGANLHPAFVNGYFQSITNNQTGPTGLASTTIRLTPAGISLPLPAAMPNSHTILSPMSPGFTPNFIPNNTPLSSSSSSSLSSSSSSSHNQCIAKTMSTLSLSSPPGSRVVTSISSIPNNTSTTNSSPSKPPPLICATALYAPTPPSTATTTTFSGISVPSSSASSSSSTSSSTTIVLSSSTQAVSAQSSATSPTPAASASPTPAAVPSQQSQTQGTDSSNHQLSSSSTSSLSSSSYSTSSLSLAHPSKETTSNSHHLSDQNTSHSPLIQVKIENTNQNTSTDTPNPMCFESDVLCNPNKHIPLSEPKTPIKSHLSPPPALVLASTKSTTPPSSTPSISPSSGLPRKTCKQKTIADIANTLHQRMSATLQQNQNSPTSSSQGSNTSTVQNATVTTQNQTNGSLQNTTVSSQMKNSLQQTNPKPSNGCFDIKHSQPQAQTPFNPASLLLSTSQIMSGYPGYNIKKETGVGMTPAPVSSRPTPPSNLFLGMPASVHPALHLRPPPLLLNPRGGPPFMHRHHHHLQHPHLTSLSSQQSRGDEPLNLVTRDKDFGLTATTSNPVGRHELHPVVK